MQIANDDSNVRSVRLQDQAIKELNFMYILVKSTIDAQLFLQSQLLTQSEYILSQLYDQSRREIITLHGSACEVSVTLVRF
jgi:hypothetical protein